MNMDRPLLDDSDDSSTMDRALPVRAQWKRWRLYGLAGVGVAIAAGWIFMSGGGRVYRVPMDRVTIGTVAQGTFEDFSAVRGVIAPFITNYLTTDQGGTVREILVEDGTQVK